MRDTGEGDAAIGAAEIEAALARILERGDGSLGNRSREFLRFIVGEALAGRSNRLKAFTIAVAVFGRDSSFDPQTNSIVRVEATRLRRWLEAYYAEAGAHDPIEIRIPRGGYTPEFLRRNGALAREPPAGLDPPAENDPGAEAPRPASRLSLRRWTAPIAAPFVIAVLAFAFWPTVSDRSFAPPSDDFPVGAIRADAHGDKIQSDYALQTRLSIAVEPASAEDGARRQAADLEFALRAALSRFSNLLVFAPPARQGPGPGDVDYVLEARFIQAGGGRAAMVFVLREAARSRIVWTKSFAEAAPELQPGTLAALVRAVTIPLAQRFGVISGDLRGRALAGALRPGLGCFARVLDAGETWSLRRRMAARSCLGEALHRAPASPLALSELADLDLRDAVDGMVPRGPGPALRDARVASRRAVELEPESSRAQAVSFEAAFLAGDAEQAFRIGRRALDLNPLDMDIAARLGAALARRGDFDQGLALIRQATEADSFHPAWIDFYEFLDAHLQGRSEEARSAAAGEGMRAFPLGLLARIIVASERGDDESKRRDMNALTAHFPRVAGDPRGFLERLRIAPAIADRLMTELRQAGLAAAQPD